MRGWRNSNTRMEIPLSLQSHATDRYGRRYFTTCRSALWQACRSGDEPLTPAHEHSAVRRNSACSLPTCALDAEGTSESTSALLIRPILPCIWLEPPQFSPHASSAPFNRPRFSSVDTPDPFHMLGRCPASAADGVVPQRPQHVELQGRYDDATPRRP